MPYVPVTNVVQAELRFLWNLQQVENTLYFYNANGWTTNGMNNLAVQLFGWWGTYMKPLQSNKVTLNEIYTTDLTTQTSPTDSYVPASGNVGTEAATALPNNVSLAVSFRTAQRGRSGRGRNYFIGLTEGQVTDNEVLTGTVGYIEDAYQALIGPLVVSAGVWGVVSRRTNNNPRIIGQFLPCTSAVVIDPIIDSQRRRLPKRGK